MQFEKEKQVVDRYVGSRLTMLINELAREGLSFEEDWYQELCCTPDPDSEGDYLEPLEFWAVDSHLGSFMKERGELITQEFGLWIWGRQTSGQAIYLDSIINDYVNNYS